MDHDHRNDPLPKVPLMALGLLALGVVVAVAVFRWTDRPPVAQLPQETAVQVSAFRFEDRADGAVLVFVAERGQPLAVLDAGTNGFLRVALRTLVRERARHGQAAPTPFVVARMASGRIVLEDPVTGRRMGLDAFGAANAEAFGRLLDMAAS